MAEHRHKRETEARRPKINAKVVTGPLAVLATAAVVTTGVLVSGTPNQAPTAASIADAVGERPAATAPTETTESNAVQLRVDPVTRNYDRAKQPQPIMPRRQNLFSKVAIQEAIENASERRWTTTDLNLWSHPGDKATQLGEVEAGTKVLITGRTHWGRTEIVIDGKARWVTSGYLSEEKPVAAAAGLSMKPCPDPGVESGLTSRAVYLYRSVCNAFPQIRSYGGRSNHGEHTSGRAIDIMTSDVELGTAIAEFLRAHAGELNLYAVIWRQRIWTPVRSGEGWRPMPNRGSATANHYDHVHVSVY